MWFIIFLIVATALVGAINGRKSAKEEEIRNEQMKLLGLLDKVPVFIDRYVGGHPDINENVERVQIFKRSSRLEIHERPGEEDFVTSTRRMGRIETKDVKNIVIEDRTTIEKRVTLGKLLLVGVFAFAWKSNKKEESAFLVIEWNDGRFDHETIFEFGGRDAVQRANVARNDLIKMVRD